MKEREQVSVDPAIGKVELDSKRESCSITLATRLGRFRGGPRQRA